MARKLMESQASEETTPQVVAAEGEGGGQFPQPEPADTAGGRAQDSP